MALGKMFQRIMGDSRINYELQKVLTCLHLYAGIGIHITDKLHIFYTHILEVSLELHLAAS